MPLLPLDQLIILEGRDRQSFDEESLDDLAGSILEVGLLHAPVVEEDGRTLVAGERRFRAVSQLSAFSFPIRFAGEHVPVGYIPVIPISRGGLAPRIAQLDENLVRKDLTWQEETAALADLHHRRVEQLGAQTFQQTAQDIPADSPLAASAAEVATAVRVSDFLSDPEVAKAGSLREAEKILRRRMDAEQHAQLAQSYDLKKLSSTHQLLIGDLFTEMPKLTEGSFDVLIFDPPYGVYANEWENQSAIPHSYEDGPETSERIIKFILEEGFRLTKPRAHLYCFCDIRVFPDIKRWAIQRNWRAFHTPLIWHNTTENRGLLPWPHSGPRRGYEAIVYATKGDRPVNYIGQDVIPCPFDMEVERAAHKPPNVYRELLQRSCRPGDLVLDPCCGTGPIFPAASEVRCVATGIELDPVAVGIAAERLKKTEPF